MALWSYKTNNVLSNYSMQIYSFLLCQLQNHTAQQRVYIFCLLAYIIINSNINSGSNVIDRGTCISNVSNVSCGISSNGTSNISYTRFIIICWPLLLLGMKMDHVNVVYWM